MYCKIVYVCVCVCVCVCVSPCVHRPSPSQKAASPLLGRAALPVVASKPRIMPTPPRSGGSSNRADILARLQAQGGGIPMPGFAMPMRPKATGVNGQTGNEDDNKEKVCRPLFYYCKLPNVRDVLMLAIFAMVPKSRKLDITNSHYQEWPRTSTYTYKW